MKLKKIMALGLATVMTSGLLVGCSSGNGSGEKTNSSALKIGMVADIAGIEDQSFNQLAWKGLQDIQATHGKEKVEIKVLESENKEDYKTHIDSFVAEDMDLIIGVGANLQGAISESAKANADQKFALIDGVVEGKPENAVSVTFEDNESAYLVGLIAGRLSETKKVGFIGGEENEEISKFQYGFMAGVKDAQGEDKEVPVLVEFTNDFASVEKGKEVATKMYDDGADIIFSVAGASGTGVIEAAKEKSRKVIGSDMDQNELAPENVLTSAIKGIDAAVYNVVETLMNDEFKGGEVVVNSLKTNGVGIAATTDQNVAPDVMMLVKETAEKIKNGELEVPSNKEEYDAKYGEQE